MIADFPVVFELSPLPMWVIDSETLQFLAVNPAACRAYGYTEAEFLQRSLYDIRPPDDHPRLRQQTHNLTEVTTPYHGSAWRHLTKEGKLRYVDIYSVAIEYQGRPARMVHVVDQTDLVNTLSDMQHLQQELEERVAERTYQLEEANAQVIRQNEERLALLLDGLEEIIWLMRQDTGEILYLNPAGERFFGATKDSLNQMPRVERQALVHEDDRQALLQLLEGLGPDLPFQLVEYRLHQPDGTIVWRESRVRYHPPGLLGIPAPLLMGITSDVTARKENQLALERSLAEQHLLLAEVHHRVKNNLAVLLSLVQLQQLHVEDHPTTAAEALQDMHNRLLAMSLVHQKLYQHALSGHLAVDTYIRELCEQVRASFGAAAAGITLELDLEPLRLDLARAVPLGLILNELLTNTWKHAKLNGQGSICVYLRRRDGRLWFRYQDTGLGDWAAPLDAHGTGLALVRALSRQLQGTVSIGSSKGFQLDLNFPAEEA